MKTRRHNKILELIKANEIDTQEELLRQLRIEGFDVTQATVSRDIKELHLVKTLSPDGKYKYAVGKDTMRDMSSKFFALFTDSAIAIESAKNIVVIKCLSGMAQAVCASMDSIHWDNVVGTLAGEDTILVVTKDDAGADQLVQKLKKIVG